MGRNHCRVLGELAGVEVCGLCDVAPQGEWVVPPFRDYREMLDRVGPGAVIVAVPTPLHREVALECIGRGIDLLIEKPVAAGVEEGKAIAAASRAAGVKVAVGYIERFNPVVSALRRELTSREILSITFTRVGHNPPRIRNMGILADLAVHDIDLLRFITGKKILRSCVFGSNKIRASSEDNALLSFRLEGDLVAGITTNWLTPFKRRRIEVATHQAYYEADLITQELTEFSAYHDDNTFVTRHCLVSKGEPLHHELNAFVRYLQTGQRGDLATIQDSIETLAVVEQGGES